MTHLVNFSFFSPHISQSRYVRFGAQAKAIESSIERIREDSRYAACSKKSLAKFELYGTLRVSRVPFGRGHCVFLVGARHSRSNIPRGTKFPLAEEERGGRDPETSSATTTATTRTTTTSGRKIKTRSGIVINGVRVLWVVLARGYPRILSRERQEDGQIDRNREALDRVCSALKSAARLRAAGYDLSFLSSLSAATPSPPRLCNLLFQWPLIVIALVATQ